jgi:transposase-like protein
MKSKTETAKNLLKEYVREQKFDSANQVLDAMKDMFKDVLQETLEAEMDENLGYQKHSVEGNNTGNSRNGYTNKTVRSELGQIQLSIPRDRNGEFEPKIVPKNERNITGIEDKILGLYASGMTTRDIAEQIKQLYDVEISNEFVSNVTNRIMPMVNDWQTRPLERVYSFVFMDAIHYKVHDEKRVVNKAAYVALGVNMGGEKEVLGIWIGQAESSKFWLGVLNDLQNRGVSNVLVFCVDGLSGFKEAISAAYPAARIQRCIIHQLRASTKYVSYKDLKAFTADLKLVYGAVNEESALENLMQAKEKWDKKYPHAIKTWEENWDCLSTFFVFPDFIRKIMYTTNTIESLNSQFRKLTKTKLIFPNDESLMKMLYLAVENISKRWTRIYTDWDKVLNQLNILFDEQLGKGA